MVVDRAIAAKDQRCRRTVSGVHVIAGEEIYTRQLESFYDGFVSPRPKKGNDTHAYGSKVESIEGT